MKQVYAILILSLMILFTGCSLKVVDQALEPEDVKSSFDSEEEPVSDELNLDKRYQNLIEENKTKNEEYLENAFEYERDPNDTRTTEEKIYDTGNKLAFFNEVVVKRVIGNSRAILIFLLLLAMCSFVFFKSDKARQQRSLKLIFVIVIFIIVFSFASKF